ncbi:MAG TPA: FtsW/RodA/SpoVE family cell cycle protein [Candidatus Saccharimonadales bacterium]|nr:FtsW/RodA/SpoVE family cell cycle protein [Candidatus Saccharimonadales bacterium]
MSKTGTYSIDFSLLAPVAILVVLGLTTLFSVNIDFFKSQIIFLVFSVLAFLFFSRLNYKIIEYYAVPVYVISLVLLFLILIVGIESRGAVRWLEIAGFRIQFSEIFKPFLAIIFASFIATREKLDAGVFLKTILFLLPVFLFIFLQPDLGNAIIYLFVVFLSLIILGFPIKYFVGAVLPGVLLLPLVLRFTHGYQKQRIVTFLHPGADPLGTSYNAIQSIIAVGSGMFTGRGLGQGTQSGLRFLPERHTDFIFATLSEGLGFIGSILVIAAFIFLLYRIYVIFTRSSDKFSRTFAITAFFLILVQFFVNIGMNIGVLPIVGVTLPFVSYGGSSLLSSFILLGMLSAVSRNVKREDVVEIR